MGSEADVRVSYGEHADQFVDMWIPSGEPRGTAVLIHGGYWRQKYTLDLMNPIAAHLREQGWAVLNLEYRRVDSKHDVWTEMSDDVRAAIELAGASPTVVVGHSAGGHLALWAATQPNLVDAVVALAPVADLRAADELNLSDGAVRELLGGSVSEVPERYSDASPLDFLPLGVPQVVVHGDADDAVPQRISIGYTAKAKAAGDDVRLLAESGLDHMQLIDPEHPIWRAIDEALSRWSTEL